MKLCPSCEKERETLMMYKGQHSCSTCLGLFMAVERVLTRIGPA
jgi:hypothetical protein